MIALYLRSYVRCNGGGLSPRLLDALKNEIRAHYNGSPFPPFSVLGTPYWKDRVKFLVGSCLVNRDLYRADVANAEAVFILAESEYGSQCCGCVLCLRTAPVC